ncbi:hypothetical protein BDZ89DRAFT_1060344 [Hymenopellis radicata]|nr:hypothetical protein BDZ89DRAFT_1060344 [Hymenopellis radicata]
MGFLSTLRRLFTYLMSSRNSDNVEPPANLILFGDPNAVDGVADKTHPMSADAYLGEFIREVRISTTDLTLQSCVTRVEFCKRRKKGWQHEYLVAHVVYWYEGRTHSKYRSVAVIDRAPGGKRCSGNRTPAVEVSSSPATSPSTPTSLSSPTHPSTPTPPSSPTIPSASSAPTPPASPPSGTRLSASSSSESLQSSRNSFSKAPDDLMIIHYGEKCPHSKRHVCASMDFDDSAPEKRLSFERLVCMFHVAHKLGVNYNVGGKNCYWLASWIWDALLISGLARSFDDGYPRSRQLGALNVLGTQVRTIHNNGQTHPCGALVRSNNAVTKEEVKKCDQSWEKLQSLVRETIEKELRRKTELQDAKALAADAKALAVTEARLRAEADTRAADAETRAATAERELALLRASLNPPAPA